MTKIGHTIFIFQQIMCCTWRKSFSFVRHRYGRSPTDQMKDLDVSTAKCGIFMSVTLQAAVHFGKDYTENLRSTKNQPLKSFETVISSDWEVDHGSDRNNWTDND